MGSLWVPQLAKIFEKVKKSSKDGNDGGWLFIFNAVCDYPDIDS